MKDISAKSNIQEKDDKFYSMLYNFNLKDRQQSSGQI